MAVNKPTIGQTAWGTTLNNALDSLDERLVAIETVVDEQIPLPDFLTYVEGRTHLPVLNTNFGWDSAGAWFGPTSGDTASYPIFTNFTIPTNYKVQVEFDIEIDSFCSDAGVALYVNGTTPEWSFGTNTTRIAAQFNCPTMEIQGIETSVSSEGEGVPDAGTYRAVLVYDPADTSDNVTFRLMTKEDIPTLVLQLALTETLPTGAYRIGFAADMDSGEGDNGDSRTYISNLSISINNGATLYEDSLQEGTSGATRALSTTADGAVVFPVQGSNDRTGTGEVLKFGVANEQSIITGSKPTLSSPTANRLVVAGQDGVAGTEFDGEGGDIYLWAGKGGGTTGNGGDIKIDGGQGGTESGEGGYVKVRGGYSNGGPGGFIELSAGDSSASTGGNVSLSAGNNYTDTESYGGSVNIDAGGSGNAMGGGTVNIRTYQAGPINLNADGKVLLNGQSGEFLNDAGVSSNQIATVGDVAAVTSSGATGSFTSADGKTVTVTSGIITSIV